MIYGKYKIEGHPQYATFLIKPESKGSVPKVLSGAYTSTGEAISAIDAHELKIKGMRNGKAKRDSGI